MIPPQLNNQRFILTHDKRPFEEQWSTIANYSAEDPILKTHLEIEPTYGVVCGINNLIVLDFDNQEVQDAIVKLLPQTFTSKTATKGLLHLYYFTDDLTTRRYTEPSIVVDGKKKKGKSILDIQGAGTMVIAPNSKLSSGKSYEIVHDIPIATIYRKELAEILKQIPVPFQVSDEEGERIKKAYDRDLSIFASPEVRKIKSVFSVRDLLQKLEIPIHKNPTECPFHDSESKKCLSYSDDLWHCFHCNKGGDVLTLYQLAYSLNFRQSVDQLFKELFINDKEYEEALKNIREDIENRKSGKINQHDIDLIAQIMIKTFNFVTLEETDKIYYYNEANGVYKSNGEYVIGAELERFFGGYSKNNVVSETISKVKRLTHKPLAMFDQHKNLICMKNGVFNKETKLIIPHSPQYYFLNYIPVNYNVSATCPNIDKFIKEIVSPEDVEAIYEIFGFCLSRDYDLQKAIMLVGQGANGKSVLLHVLRMFLGFDNISAESLHDIMEDPFSACNLFGKLANISADISDSTLKENKMFKDLTSGVDMISAQYKFQNKFNFVNYAKLIFSCNTVPRSNDTTNGFMRRWKIIPFPNTFEGKADNKNLKYELCSENEMSGLFNQAIERYFRLKQNGQFTNDKTVDETRDEYINLSDPLQVFIDKHLIQDMSSEIFKNELLDRYNVFCKDSKIPSITPHALTSLLKRKNIRFKTVGVKIDNKYTTREAITGYTWRTEEGNNDVVNL